MFAFAGVSENAAFKSMANLYNIICNEYVLMTCYDSWIFMFLTLLYRSPAVSADIRMLPNIHVRDFNTCHDRARQSGFRSVLHFFV